MLPDTISSLELIRFFVALYGIRVAWTGRRLALASLRTIAPEQPSDLHERSSQALRSERMRLFEVIQTGILCVHLLLLANVVINMAYPSGSVEQPNVMSSNVAQILIPFILIRLSELIVAEMGVAGRMRSVTGPRTPPVAAKEEP